MRVDSTGVRAVTDSEVDLAALYAAHHLSMVRLARLLVDDLASAEDVVQDAFLGLHRRQGQLRDPGAAVGYIRQAVVNQARSQLRRRRTVRAHLRVAEPEIGPAADADLMLSEEHREVLAAVNQLPERQREVLILRFWSGLSETEIAETMGVSNGTVKSQASRAMKTLQQILEAERGRA
ncbi:RNA polymerase subunit sigma-24 [Luteipulveratus halotolerans]|uniref:RNA polymerase subunit sigma-24 n=1 Tax=Luteipulveratus halotolerans TaxID=1631356 RepID=A0A0L6CDS1_9MICO|nr:RNA polymerase subunit sigma-24 [Luteipulveratus halotolerans]